MIGLLVFFGAVMAVSNVWLYRRARFFRRLADDRMRRINEKDAIMFALRRGYADTGKSVTLGNRDAAR